MASWIRLLLKRALLYGYISCLAGLVVHELCHLLEPSHNARFHALMDKFFPRWKEARKETRQICKMEEDEDE